MKLNYLFLIVMIQFCKAEKFPEYKEYLYQNRLKSELQVEESKNYIQNISKENNIEYTQIKNSTAYIPPMCYTNTVDKSGITHNPCYACHTVGQKPNFINDSDLQTHYEFPEQGKINPWKNLFKNTNFNSISDLEIQKYIEEDNYKNKNGEIYLGKILPQNWGGYRPDCYFSFDDEGFDKNPQTGEYTGWRAYRYYPFLGTFWATNGSTDDVLIRLPFPFRADKNKNFNLEIYKTNLAILESVIKQESITTELIDESVSGLDLDGNGKLEITNQFKYNWPTKSIEYVGLAKHYQTTKEISVAGGLFPVGTEFLHSVRYIDWDTAANTSKLSNRIKELRYAVKKEWYNYSELKDKISREYKDLRFRTEKSPEGFYGDYEYGYDNKTGWTYSGFIEDKNGNLRPQTNEETLFCMGCHSSLGVLADGTFSFKRKLDGSDKSLVTYGWGHWSKNGISGLPDRITNYQNFGDQKEYSFYLENNLAGDEFRENEEIKNLFFKKNGTKNSELFEKLRSDISILIHPSKERSISLNKSYKKIVESQSFRFGRDSILQKPNHILSKISKDQVTNIEKIIF
ncbi:MAG: hypothetical protein IPL26_26755 [Leptospiraceae bacterium]|nr:hypothetical protein [Leptospiraceae bacterium]